MQQDRAGWAYKGAVLVRSHLSAVDLAWLCPFGDVLEQSSEHELLPSATSREMSEIISHQSVTGQCGGRFH